MFCIILILDNNNNSNIYLKKLEHIIEKDFFPDLEKLRIQQAYYEAKKNNDYDTLRDLYSRYNNILNKTSRRASQPQTPALFDSTPGYVQPKKGKETKPAETPYANEEPPDGSEDCVNVNSKEEEHVSLDCFLAKNTSEDNVSFDIIINDAENKEKSKLHNSWLYEKEKFHKLVSD